MASVMAGGPTTSASTSSYSNCLVCSAVITTRYLGVESCRACGEFFRRTTAKSLQYTCRQGTNNCEVAKNAQYKCKSCRYTKCVQAGFSSHQIECRERPSNDSNVASTSQNKTQHPRRTSLEANKPFSALIESITEAGATSNGPDLPLLKKIEQNYRIFCAVMKANDHAHSEAGPLYGNSREKKKYRIGTYDQMNAAFRVTIVALYEFADVVFDGFRDLDESDKLNIIRACYEPLVMCACFRRTLEEFPDDPHIIITSDTTCFRFDNLESVFDQAKDQACRPEAEQLVSQRWVDMMRLIRPQVKDAGMDETEYFVYIGLCFGCLPGCTGIFSDAALSLAENFRNRLFSEFHLYCKHRIGLSNYASKLGRMMSLLSTCQAYASRALEEMELYRLLDLVPDDSAAYDFHKRAE